ncbi:hypothetical protein ACVBEF_10975 [Glaciimonas sp. GG7]
MTSSLRRIFSCVLLTLTATTLFSASAQDALVPCRRFLHQIECVAVPLATPVDDAQAKQFDAPLHPTAKVYLSRPGTMAPKQKSDIFLDGKWIGSLAPMTYLVIETAPGTHILGASGQANANSALTMTLEVDKNTYVQEQLYQLFNTEKITFKVVDTQTGQADVLKSRLISKLISAGINSHHP